MSQPLAYVHLLHSSLTGPVEPNAIEFPTESILTKLQLIAKANHR